MTLQAQAQAQAQVQAKVQDQGPSLNILVVDDHAIVREGLKRILEGTASGWTVVEAGTGFEALEILRQQAFDVAVIDLSMPGMSGLELLRRARPRLPRLRVLMLSMHAEEQYAIRAFKAGANGYITKDSATRELAAAVRKVAEGGVYVSGSLAERMVLQLNGAHVPARHTQLSDRELEVLQRLVAGHRPTEIAKALHLSVKTVSTHKSRILDRLQLPNMAALIRYGMEQGLSMIDALPVVGLQSGGAETPMRRSNGAPSTVVRLDLEPTSTLTADVVRLYAADAVHEQSLQVAHQDQLERHKERHLAAARASPGVTAFDTACSEGEALDLDEASEQALALLQAQR